MPEDHEDSHDRSRFSRAARSTPSVYATAIVTVIITVVATKAFDIPGWLMSDRQAIWDEVNALQNDFSHVLKSIERIERDVDKRAHDLGTDLQAVVQGLQEVRRHIQEMDHRMAWLHGPGQEDRRTLDEYEGWTQRDKKRRMRPHRNDEPPNEDDIQNQLWKP